MKWSVFICVAFCLLRYGEGGALKCIPGSQDRSCSSDLEEKEPPIQISIDDSPEGRAMELQCLPGSEWESNCHSCRCTESGRSRCQKKDVCESGILGEPIRCKPYTSFQRGCRTCMCTAIGQVLCSPCTESTLGREQAESADKEESLIPIIRSSLSTNKSVVCVANRMFIKDCNTCWCNEDGTSYFCTRRVCVEENPDELRGEDKEEGSEKLRIIKKQCKPNEVFELDCNMCRCNPDGQSYSCTRRACFELPDDFKNLTLSRKTRRASQQSDAPKTCQPGQEFRMDCNKCLCDNEGQDFSCTRIDCNAVNNNHQAAAFTQTRTKREASEKVSGGCNPGELFARGCNMCRCSSNGQVAACTLKQCPSDKDGEADRQATDLDPSFRCNAGEQFKQDCNDCTCSADGKSVFCTLRLCDMDLTPDISI
ncbi:hypothetical protein K1T71_012936 [Dendrolimus kikuchii]|uniref:Uncharacterized protein n=1 Tax=Dendrolimus kikuchii TaxID=765133 RepID=A0ACC1CII9_9NEOP|nr:hypothetical protein K1T71_012936 [Dendrolimus kikuchii]